MSPASRSKSKDKKVSKETQKAALKSSEPANASSSNPVSAYNPVVGSFHALELPSSAASPIQTTSRFQNIDVTDELLTVSIAAGIESDTVSNNGSWSGESEVHKTSISAVPLDAVPGADNDKRDKTRLKNEKKHQRQKERRSQELHERCTCYLMSRKLESITQQLVAMGFSQERATVALVSNEGRLEESVAWLFEVGDEEQSRDQNLNSGSLKIDISEELARIAELELRFKCSKQDVERALVASEGDFEQAEETLRELKLELPSAPPKSEEASESTIVSNYNLSTAPDVNLDLRKANSHTTPQRKNENDFNYTKAAVVVGGSTEPASNNVQPLKRLQPKLEWEKLQQTALPSEKRWPNDVLNPSPSYSLTSSSLPAAPSLAKPETRYVATGSEFKNFLRGHGGEPVIMVQRPQSISRKHIPAATSLSSSPPGVANIWGSTNGTEILKPSEFVPQINNNLTSKQLYHQFQHQQRPLPSNSNGGGEFHRPNGANISWGRSNASQTVAAASSLGLFAGMGSVGSSGLSSPVDWSTGGSMLHLDYANIDWSLNKGLPSRGGAGGLLQGFSSFAKTNVHTNNANISRADTHQPLTHQPLTRSTSSVLNGVSLAGLQEGRGTSANESANTGIRVWASPFEERDIFSLPRQFVTSPPL